jgi:hypothetical protein
VLGESEKREREEGKNKKGDKEGGTDKYTHNLETITG